MVTHQIRPYNEIPCRICKQLVERYHPRKNPTCFQCRKKYGAMLNKIKAKLENKKITKREYNSYLSQFKKGTIDFTKV